MPERIPWDRERGFVFLWPVTVAGRRVMVGWSLVSYRPAWARALTVRARFKRNLGLALAHAAAACA